MLRVCSSFASSRLGGRIPVVKMAKIGHLVFPRPALDNAARDGSHASRGLRTEDFDLRD